MMPKQPGFQQKILTDGPRVPYIQPHSCPADLDLHLALVQAAALPQGPVVRKACVQTRSTEAAVCQTQPPKMRKQG